MCKTSATPFIWSNRQTYAPENQCIGQVAGCLDQIYRSSHRSKVTRSKIKKSMDISSGMSMTLMHGTASEADEECDMWENDVGCL